MVGLLEGLAGHFELRCDVLDYSVDLAGQVYSEVGLTQLVASLYLLGVLNSLRIAVNNFAHLSFTFFSKALIADTVCGMPWLPAPSTVI